MNIICATRGSVALKPLFPLTDKNMFLYISYCKDLWIEASAGFECFTKVEKKY